MSNSAHHTRFLKIGLVLVILLGTYLRINASIHTTVEYPLRADAGQYFSYAFNLRHYGVYSHEQRFERPVKDGQPRPDALRSPGYSLALAPFAGEIPTGNTILHIILTQAALGILMIPLVYIAGRRLLPGAWPLLPALLVAISPQLIASSTYVLSETLFAFLMLLGICSLVVQFQQPEKHGVALLSGLLIGLAALTRPTLQFLLPVILAGMLPLLPVGTRWRHAGWLVMGFAIAFLPWIIRNYLTLGVGSDPTLTVNALVHGHYPNMMFEGRPESLGYPYRFDPHISEISASVSAALSGIWQRFLADPATYMQWYLVGKPIAYLSWGDVAAAGDIFTYPTLQSPYYEVSIFKLTKVIMQYTHWLWMLLAIAAILSLALPRLRNGLNSGHRTTLQVLACVTLYFIGIHVVGFPIARYNYPLLPVVYLLATYMIVRLFHNPQSQPSC